MIYSIFYLDILFYFRNLLLCVRCYLRHATCLPGQWFSLTFLVSLDLPQECGKRVNNRVGRSNKNRQESMYLNINAMWISGLFHDDTAYHYQCADSAKDDLIHWRAKEGCEQNSNLRVLQNSPSPLKKRTLIWNKVGWQIWLRFLWSTLWLRAIRTYFQQSKV